MPERPLRLCDVCGGLDDHPRHVTTHAPDSTDGRPTADIVAATDGKTIPSGALIDFASRTVSVRHMDCCAAQGCEVCTETEAANGGKRGQKLIDHLDKVRTSDG